MSPSNDTSKLFETGLENLTTPYLLTVTVLEPNARLYYPCSSTWRCSFEQWKLYVPDAAPESTQELVQEPDVAFVTSQQQSGALQVLGRENALRITDGTGVLPDLSSQSAAYNHRVTDHLHKFGWQVRNLHASYTVDEIMNKLKNCVGQMPHQDRNQDMANMTLLILTEAEQRQLYEQHTLTMYTRMDPINLWWDKWSTRSHGKTVSCIEKRKDGSWRSKARWKGAIMHFFLFFWLEVDLYRPLGSL